MSQKILRIGTRSSKMALIQAHLGKDLLEKTHPDLTVDIVTVKAPGDWDYRQSEHRLSEADGGKGLFISSIEEALLDKTVDIGLHCTKDVPSFLTKSLAMDIYMLRDSANDAFISNTHKSLDDMPEGAIIGTASLRRQSLILSKYPHLKVEVLRGNVPTRLNKLDNGQVDALVLAEAGLVRLQMQDRISSILDPEWFTPACGQGALSIEYRENDSQILELLKPIQDDDVALCIETERALLKVLNGSCRTPIGAYAQVKNRTLYLNVFIGSPDGKRTWRDTASSEDLTLKAATQMAENMGHSLLDKIDNDILSPELSEAV